MVGVVAGAATAGGGRRGALLPDRLVLDIGRRLPVLALGDFLELQAELHRRIEEAVDRLERNAELFRNAAERQADLEAALVHGQIPELVLQDDGHLLGILHAQPVRHAHALGVGVERNVEMMIARQVLLLGDVGEHVAHHAAQRLLGQEIVAEMVGHAGSGVWRQDSRDASAAHAPNAIPARRRAGRCHNWNRRGENESGGFCCQVPPNPA